MLKPDREGWWLITFQICFLAGRLLPDWFTLPSMVGASYPVDENQLLLLVFLKVLFIQGFVLGTSGFHAQKSPSFCTCPVAF